MKLSRFSKKQWALIGISILFVPLWIFIIGGYATYRLYKSKLSKNLRYSLVAFSVILTLIVGTLWAGAFLEDNDIDDSQEIEISSQNNQQEDINDNATDDAQEVTSTPSAKLEKHTVKRVIDGDTIELDTGKKVRYIGIDTPEIKNTSKGIECYSKEALDKNSELVSGKEIKLEKDVSETDRYGRLLRYVYIDDIFVNDYLVRQGYAHASSYPPDIKHQDQFKAAEIEARENKRGIWSDACYKPVTPVPTNQSQPVTKPVVQPVPTQPPAQPQTGSYTCDCSKSCTRMSSCDEAYYQLNQCGCSSKDKDDDGVPCESICN